jgi:hypothetical protein
LELARLMKRSGCMSVCLGIESGSEYVRNKLMGKGVTNDHIVKAVECFKKVGLPAGGLMLLGYPGETDEHFEQSRRFLSSLPLSFITIGFVYPFPGTALHEGLCDSGIIDAQFDPLLDDYIEPVFDTPEASIAQLKIRYSKLLMGFYASHAGQIIKEFLQGRTLWITGKGIKRLILNLF